MSTFPIQESLVLFRGNTDQLLVLNPTARVIWESTQQGLGIEDTAGQLSKVYGICAWTARAHVRETIASWTESGLLSSEIHEEVAPQPSPTNGFYRRIRMPAWGEQTYRLFDKIFSIRFGTKRLWNAVERLLAHLTERHAVLTCSRIDFFEAEHGFEIWRDGREVIASPKLDVAIMALHREILAVGDCRDFLVSLHAAAVSDGESCIVMPALGGSGKSTLTAALLHHGFTFLSDDVVPLERDGLLAVPLPVCLNLKTPSLKVLSRYYPGIESLPGYWDSGAMVHLFPPPGFAENEPSRKYQVRQLVFPRYQQGASTTLERISAVESLQLLIESESRLQRPIASETVGELIRWVESVPSHSLVYSDVEEAARCVGELFRRN